jgi:hypothetical protein
MIDVHLCHIWPARGSRVVVRKYAGSYGKDPELRMQVIEYGRRTEAEVPRVLVEGNGDKFWACVGFLKPDQGCAA